MTESSPKLLAFKFIEGMILKLQDVSIRFPNHIPWEGQGEVAGARGSQHGLALVPPSGGSIEEGSLSPLVSVFEEQGTSSLQVLLLGCKWGFSQGP